MSRLAHQSDGGSKSEKEVRLYRIAAKMMDEGLSAEFVSRVMRSALEYEGVADMVVLWSETPTGEQRDEIVIALDEEAEDFDPKKDPPVRKPKINFVELDAIAEDVMGFKNALRDKVDAWGGVVKLARATGIPQPSLSRFFNSASMPRRTTLYKIALAMDLSETEIATRWKR